MYQAYLYCWLDNGLISFSVNKVANVDKKVVCQYRYVPLAVAVSLAVSFEIIYSRLASRAAAGRASQMRWHPLLFCVLRFF
jgi:hypothetical protein